MVCELLRNFQSSRIDTLYGYFVEIGRNSFTIPELQAYLHMIQALEALAWCSRAQLVTRTLAKRLAVSIPKYV